MNQSKSTSPEPPDAESKPKRGPLLLMWRGFWLIFLVASLAYAWHCFYVPSNEVAWADDYKSAQEQAAVSDKPMILFFTADWCVPCRIMKRTVWADEDVAAAVNEGFVPVTIYVTDPDVGELLKRYHIGMTPITVITDADGQALRHVTGKVDKAEFLAWLGETGPASEVADGSGQ